jgi:hypothetical protein
MRLPDKQTGRRILALAVVVAVCWAATRWFTAPGNAERQTVTITDLTQPPVRKLHALTFDADTREVRATGLRSYFQLDAPSERRYLRAVTLRIRPLEPLAENEFLAYRVRPNAPPEAFEPEHEVHSFVTRGSSRIQGDGRCIRWDFADATVACQIICPPNARFRLESLEVVEEVPEPRPGTIPSFLRAGGMLVGGFVLWGIVFTLQQLWPGTRLRPETIRSLLLLLLAGSCVQLIFLLAPFQAPDEWRHWKWSLTFFRKDARSETALFNLPETLGAVEIRFRSENQLDGQSFHAPPNDTCVADRLWAFSYGSPLTYPVVGLVSALFPHVDDTATALQFYYFCRAVPAVLLFVLLFLANRANLLNYSALVFFSSPLVLQQFVAVSADTLPNLGTVLAVLLFAAHQRKPGLALQLALWVVCLAVAAAKPPVYAGLLLLPAQLLPFRKIPYRWAVLAIVVVLGVLVGGRYVQKGAAQLRAGMEEREPGSAAKYDEHVKQLGTPEGVREFAAAWWNTTRMMHWLTDWFHPLGWLDVHFSQRHLTLVILSVVVAVLLDVILIGPGLLRDLLRDKQRGLLVLGTVVVHMLFLYFSSCLILYIIESPPGQWFVGGFQMRYLFSGAIVALMLPLAAFTQQQPERESVVRRLADSAAVSLLPWLLLARQVGLAADLFARYW